MKKHLIYLTGLWALLIFGCTPAPVPIEFGSDMCHYCKMTIVDRQHAAQLVTTKGKAQKFDAIECMLNHIADQEPSQYAFMLVKDYENPGVWLNAEESHFLICKDIPSPMGAYLSAVTSPQAGQKVLADREGEILAWDNILNRITNSSTSDSQSQNN